MLHQLRFGEMLVSSEEKKTIQFVAALCLGVMQACRVSDHSSKIESFAMVKLAMTSPQGQIMETKNDPVMHCSSVVKYHADCTRSCSSRM